MHTRTPITNMFDECFISHSYGQNGVIITLKIMNADNHVADILFCPQIMDTKVILVEKNALNFVLQHFDLMLSWMKAYAIGLDNRQLENTSANQLFHA